MPPAVRDVARLVRQARDTITELRQGSRLGQAWLALQVRDADGNPLHVLPYTDTAIALLRECHEADPEDHRVLHHLAIALHARAWDLELAGRPEAEESWREALDSWYRLVNTPPFWDAMRKKLRACDPGADPTVVDQLRRSLPEQLLDIHADFVKHYCDSDQHDRALVHVRIINTAHIPPALRKSLTTKVCQAMTGSVPEAKVQKAFRPALTSIDRFLALFPDHLPGLRLHAEVCFAWVGGLSYQTDWDEIEEVSRLAEPVARRLTEHAELDETPLARAALEELIGSFLARGYDRTSPYLKRPMSELSDQELVDWGRALEFTIRWGEVTPTHRADSRSHELYGICLFNRGLCLRQQAYRTHQTDLDEVDKAQTCVDMVQRAIDLLERAAAQKPDDERTNELLEECRQALRGYEQSLAYHRDGILFSDWDLEDNR